MTERSQLVGQVAESPRGRFRGLGSGPAGRAGRLHGGFPEVLEDLEGAEVQAVRAIDAALNAEKGIEGVREGVAERQESCWRIGSGRFFGVAGVVGSVAGGPELGLNPAEAGVGSTRRR